MANTESSTATRTIPLLGGTRTAGGHFEEFCAHPAKFLLRAYRECGELVEFDQGGRNTVLMVGPAAHEAVFRAPDEQLSAAVAYQFMVPVFGNGVQYGAPLEIERQQLRMHSQGLRAERMTYYAPVIARETEQWSADWGDTGEMDFYAAFEDLTINTSTHCLFGADFRFALSDEFGALYHDLGAAVDASGTADHTAQKAAYQRRDSARARLGEYIATHVNARRAAGAAHEDMLQVYMNSTLLDGSRLSDEQIAGMVVWFMFAGHHTSAYAAA